MDPNQQNKQASKIQPETNKDQYDHNQRAGWRGITGDKGRVGASRNMYEGHMDKAKGGVFEGGRWGWVGHGGVVG